MTVAALDAMGAIDTARQAADDQGAAIGRGP
jgi:hypothetical protein